MVEPQFPPARPDGSRAAWRSPGARTGSRAGWVHRSRIGSVQPPGRQAQIGRNRMIVVAAGIFLLIVLFCFVGPLALPHGPGPRELQSRSTCPRDEGHPLGTDDSGYDVLGRLMAGGQTSLIVCVTAAFLAAGVGSAVGAFAGFAGGVLDPILMRFTDAFIAIPQLFVVIVVATMVTPSRSSLILLIGGLSWFTTARLVRGEALRIRKLEYVELPGSRARGAGARS